MVSCRCRHAAGLFDGTKHMLRWVWMSLNVAYARMLRRVTMETLQLQFAAFLYGWCSKIRIEREISPFFPPHFFFTWFVRSSTYSSYAAKNVYGTTLANVDFLHGPAEFLLTLTNLFIVLGLQRGIKKAEAKKLSKETSSKDEAMSSSSSAGYNIDEWPRRHFLCR